MPALPPLRPHRLHDRRTGPGVPAPGEIDGWITPPTGGGERLDGRSTYLLTADRLITGRRGRAPGALEVIGNLPVARDATADAARQAGLGGAALIRADRIVAVGTTAELTARLAELADAVGTPPDQVHRIDLPGCTLLPGLIETHAHLASSDSEVEYPDYGPHEVARLTLNAARAARQLLSVGVTSVQSLGARHYVDVALRQAIAAGDVRGPRVRASGPQITTTAGHAWYHHAEVDGLDDIRHEVRRHHKMGVDVIKAMATGGFTTGGSTPWNPQFSLEELSVLFADAHRLGKWTAAHAHGVEGIERAVRAGVDYLAHATFLTNAGRTQWDPRLGELMAESGVYVDCTIVPDLPRMIERDDSFVPPVLQLWEAGVRIVAGRDSGIPGVPQRGYVGGLEAMEWIGLPRSEVLLAATSRAAAAIGCAGVTGVLAEGFDADIIAVAGDPREGLRVLRDLRLVVAAGREFVPDALEGLAARGLRPDDRTGVPGGTGLDLDGGPSEILARWRERHARASRHPEV